MATSLAALADELLRGLPALYLEQSQRFPEYFLAVLAESLMQKDNPNTNVRSRAGKLYNQTGGLLRAFVPGGKGNRYKRSVSVDGLVLEFGADPEQIRYVYIHEYGGTFTITPKQRKFFWYKYYSTGAIMWRQLALAKQYTMPARPFFNPTKDKVQKEYGKELVQKILARQILELWSKAG